MCAVKTPALALAVFAVLTSTSSARADERSTNVVLAGVIGGRLDPHFGDLDYQPRDPSLIGGPRLTLDWEHGPLAYPAQRGYNVGGELVPELIGGLLFDQGNDDPLHRGRGEAMVGAGLRAELRIAQKQMGMLQVTMRANMYIAARAFVIGDQRDPASEFAFGEAFYVQNSTRIGFEVGLMRRHHADQPADEHDTNLISQIYIGWAL